MNESDRKKILSLRMLYGFETIKQESSSEKEFPSDIVLTDEDKEILDKEGALVMLRKKRERLEVEWRKRREKADSV